MVSKRDAAANDFLESMTMTMSMFPAMKSKCIKQIHRIGNGIGEAGLEKAKCRWVVSRYTGSMSTLCILFSCPISKRKKIHYLTLTEKISVFLQSHVGIE